MTRQDRPTDLATDPVTGRPGVAYAEASASGTERIVIVTQR